MLPHRATVDLGAMAIKGNLHSPMLQHHWNLTVRLFSVVSRTFVWGVLPLCRGAVSVFYSPSRLGNKRFVHSIISEGRLNSSYDNIIFVLDNLFDQWNLSTATPIEKVSKLQEIVCWKINFIWSHSMRVCHWKKT